MSASFSLRSSSGQRIWRSRGGTSGRLRRGSLLSLLVAGSIFATVIASGPAEARPYRSPQARAEFVRATPCPSTGKPRGACPGWEVDHVEPLKCGGADAPANMQWLTVEQHRAKTKMESKLCRK